MNLQEIKNRQNSQTDSGTVPNTSPPATMPEKQPITPMSQTEQTAQPADMKTMISAMNRKILQLKNELSEEIKLNLKLNEEIKNIPRLPKNYGETMEDYRKTKQEAAELRSKTEALTKQINRKNEDITVLSCKVKSLSSKLDTAKDNIFDLKKESEDLTAISKCDEHYINYVTNLVKTERNNFKEQRKAVSFHFGRMLFLLIIMLAAFARSSPCISLDMADFVKTIGKAASSVFISGNSDITMLASFLPFKALQIITSAILFVFFYAGTAIIICGAAVGLYVLCRKFSNILMGDIVLYVTVLVFIFADVLNIRGRIGLNSIVLILLINTGVFTIIAIKRYIRKEHNKYSFKNEIHNLIDKLEDISSTPKPKEDDSISGKSGIESCDIAELVRKKYASRQLPENPKSSFADGVKIIFRIGNMKL